MRITKKKHGAAAEVDLSSLASHTDLRCRMRGTLPGGALAYVFATNNAIFGLFFANVSHIVITGRVAQTRDVMGSASRDLRLGSFILQ